MLKIKRSGVGHSHPISGHVSVEYLLLLGLVVLALASGRPSAIEQLISAIQISYQRFSFAMSAP
jgi:hypothetical protein